MFLLGLGVYLFLLRPITDRIENEIVLQTKETAQSLYVICDQSAMEILRHATSDDDPYVNVKKAYTIGLIEDLVQRKG